jgi:hypothetical protein
MERPGEIVTREELRRRLWSSDTFVDFEVALNSAVSRLRDALGDSAESSQLHRDCSEARLSICGADPQTARSGRDAVRQPDRRCPG